MAGLNFNRVDNHKRGIIIEILLYEFDTILTTLKEEVKEEHNLYGGEQIDIKLISIYSGEEKGEYELTLEWKIIHKVANVVYISDPERKKIKLPLEGSSYQLLNNMGKRTVVNK